MAMDCVMIDSASFEQLKSEREDANTRADELERENDALKSCNQLMSKLVDSLENIKFNLEKTVELMRNQYSIAEQFQPFERDCIVWDEEYCNIKCMLTQLEDSYDCYDDTCGTVDDDDPNGIIIHCNDDNDVIIDDSVANTADDDDDENGICNDDNTVENDDNDECVISNDTQSDDKFSGNVSHELRSIDTESWNNHCDNNNSCGDSIGGVSVHTISVTGNGSEVFGLLSTEMISMNAITGSDEKEEKPKIRRNRKSLLTEGVLVSTTPGTKRFNCQWENCSYATNSSGNFQKHYRIHTGEKPYKCDFDGCNYSCSDPGSIKEHKRIHSIDKEFVCEWPGCTWKFSTYKLLKNHTRACHTGEKPHKCDWPGCEKSFLAPYALRTHKLKHTGDRPFKCDVVGCKGAFTRSTDLLRHKRETHCTEKQFHCDYDECGAKFYRRDDLRHHTKRKHEYPPFGRRKKTNKVGRPPKKTRVSVKTELMDDAIDEPKVVIDLNVAKVNQLKKSIQINFV